MDQREKVIEGLECCMTNPYLCDRTNCPYAGKGDENDYCDMELIKDTIALLNAQEPITGETSDGYHTFNELYHHRAVLFSVIVAHLNHMPEDVRAVPFAI